MTKPVTPAQAEALAKGLVAEYLRSCHCDDPAEVANYLMKLCSVAGVLMACSVGGDNAFDRLVGTAHFVRNNMPAGPAALRPVQ